MIPIFDIPQSFTSIFTTGCSGIDQYLIRDRSLFMWEAHYIGDSVVDGATLDWEHYERFQDMSEDSIANLTLQDYEKYEEQRMEKNAWRFARQLAQRIDGAPVLSDYRTFTQAFQNVQKTLFLMANTRR